MAMSETSPEAPSPSHSNTTWKLTYPGLHLSGHYNPSKTVYTLSIEPPPAHIHEIPPFTLNLPTPLPSLTSVLLPGSSTIVQLSADEEISVWSHDASEPCAVRGRELLRLDGCFRRVLEAGDEMVTGVRDVWQGQWACSVEARAGVCGQEGFIVVCCYRFFMGEGSVASAFSECGRVAEESASVSASGEGYERFLEGL